MEFCILLQYGQSCIYFHCTTRMLELRAKLPCFSVSCHSTIECWHCRGQAAYSCSLRVHVCLYHVLDSWRLPEPLLTLMVQGSGYSLTQPPASALVWDHAPIRSHCFFSRGHQPPLSTHGRRRNRPPDSYTRNLSRNSVVWFERKIKCIHNWGPISSPPANKEPWLCPLVPTPTITILGPQSQYVTFIYFKTPKKI